MKISDIRIPLSYTTKSPAKEKVKKITDFYKSNGKLDKPIKLSKNNVLIDGYARYMALRNLGVTDIDDTFINVENNFTYTDDYVTVTYISTVFNNKEYVWVNDKGYKIKEGDIVKVLNKKEYKNIIVNKVYLSDPQPQFAPHKTILKKVEE